jgi:hypothetical protein
MPKEFYVMDKDNCVGDNKEPYIFKVLVEVYLNKLASLADPENRLIFRIAMWSWDADMDRKKRIAGVRYYPLQRKLTKITDKKVETPYKVFNQKEVLDTIDKTIQEILNDEEFKDSAKDTLEYYCKKCKKGDWNCKCGESGED